MSYENQLKVWAVEKYGTLDPDHIKEVRITQEEEHFGYCETCDFTEIQIRVKVITTGGDVIIDESYRDYEYSFQSLLKEIIEAGSDVES